MKTLTYEFAGLMAEPVKLSLKEELVITEDIDSEVDNAAANYGFYAVLAEKAESRYQKLKYSYEVWRAGHEREKSEALKVAAEKAFTVNQMDAYVMSNPKYNAYQAKLIQLDEHRRILKVVSRAFDVKSELVRTKASNRRAEMGR